MEAGGGAGRSSRQEEQQAGGSRRRLLRGPRTEEQQAGGSRRSRRSSSSLDDQEQQEEQQEQQEEQEEQQEEQQEQDFPDRGFGPSLSLMRRRPRDFVTEKARNRDGQNSGLLLLKTVRYRLRKKKKKSSAREGARSGGRARRGEPPRGERQVGGKHTHGLWVGGPCRDSNPGSPAISSVKLSKGGAPFFFSGTPPFSVHPSGEDKDVFPKQVRWTTTPHGRGRRTSCPTLGPLH